MSRITSSVGLITGIPIEDTVKKLMEVAARPRTLLTARNDDLKKQQTALDALGARLLSFQFALNKLKTNDIFATREVSSTNPDVLSAALPATGTASVGSFQVRPARSASAQQVVSQRFDSADDIPSSGTLTLRLGGFVDRGIALAELNDGAGVSRGKIRITDRSGSSGTIDLSLALTVDDVVAAINASDDVAVTASVDGDSFTLVDSSGGSGNLKVSEVGGGTTAAGLGLAGINVADNSATGADVFRLHAGTKLATLNDGNGVQVSGTGVVDLDVDLKDGTSLAIDLHDVVTLGDVLQQINAANPAKLSAAISADGNRLVLTDLTGGGGSFSVANGVAGTTADDLGVATSVAGATITGGRLVAGLRDVLASSLAGGAGLGALGVINITDRDGQSGPVDLAAAETLDDVVDLINASAAEVSASINPARNGIIITDESGGSGNLVIADGDASNSATKLGVVVNAAVASVNSGTLRRQTISKATLLSSLNGGRGVSLGDIRITDSAGVSKTADLNSVGSEPKTVGDVIDAINALTNGVEARINDNGDGVILVDTAHGSSTLGVKDTSGNIAASLNLTRASQTVDISGTPTQVVDGAATQSVDLSDLDDSAAGIPLSSLNGGSGVPEGFFTIADSFGRKIAIDLGGADAGLTTVDQLVDLINSRGDARPGGFTVTARINNSGDGILLEDAGNGAKKLTVADGNSTTAAVLKIAGTATNVGGVQRIDGAGAFNTESTPTPLDALVARINELDAGVTASKVFDGVGYRLSLLAEQSGAANELLVDAAAAGFVFEESSRAQDAILLYGNLNAPGGGLLLSSPDGNFPGAVGGVDLKVKGESSSPVTVNVSQTDTALMDAIEDIVASYNSLRSDLGKLTSFDGEALTTGLLFGTNEALQVDSRLSSALTDRYLGLGDFQTLAQVGISVADDGTLELDKAKLQEAFENDPAALEEFFTNPDVGVVKKLNAAIDRLAGAEGSLLVNRSDALQDTIKANQDRIDRFTESLTRQQERLTLQFVQLEQIVARLQTSLSALQNLQVIPPLGS